ncbi:MAG TPA: DUF4390 domain-containing protein [Burkholderiales bacterium]
MPACISVSNIAALRIRRSALWVLATSALPLLCAPAVLAGFAVGTIQPRIVERVLQVNGNLDLTLTPKVEEAIGKGIPVQLVIDLRLFRRRPLIWDERIETWGLRRELSYHALSGQYLVGSVSAVPTDRESFTSLNEALAELGAIDGVALSIDEPLVANADLRLDVRVRLDIEALPSLLRPVAYTSSDWNLNSEWTTWKVQR